jgi:hypothetical protein
MGETTFMVGHKIKALALAAAIVLAPALAIAQEEGAAAGEEGLISTPFGAASPVVVGGVVLGAVIGLTIALDDNGDNDEATGATGTGGTGAGGTQ